MSKVYWIATQIHQLANVSKELEEAGDTAIYDMTGCLSACEKYKIDLTNNDVSGEVNTTETELIFIINDGYHVEEEQYVIYDFNSFVADTGGYMGLILGTSFLSMYDQLILLLKRVKSNIPKKF